MKICAHTLFKNEERYLWFSVMSVIEHVDRLMLWDTGSTDKSREIAKEILKRYPQKIDYREFKNIDAMGYTKLRIKLLNETHEDWFMVLDGDEVWWEDKIRESIEIIKKNGSNFDSIVVYYKNLVGDIFHYQDESVSKYVIDGEHGFVTIRMMNRKIPGLYCNKEHGQFGYYDKDNELIQDRSSDRRVGITQDSYMHFTNLIRSGDLEHDYEVVKRKGKYKIELGKEFALDYYYPEVFFKDRPEIVPNPWVKFDNRFKLKAKIITPIKKIKRKVLAGGVGY